MFFQSLTCSKRSNLLLICVQNVCFSLILRLANRKSLNQPSFVVVSTKQSSNVIFDLQIEQVTQGRGSLSLMNNSIFNTYCTCTAAPILWWY